MTARYISECKSSLNMTQLASKIIWLRLNALETASVGNLKEIKILFTAMKISNKIQGPEETTWYVVVVYRLIECMFSLFTIKIRLFNNHYPDSILIRYAQCCRWWKSQPVAACRKTHKRMIIFVSILLFRVLKSKDTQLQSILLQIFITMNN